MNRKEAAAERTRKLLEQNPNHFKELAARSQLQPHKNRSFQVNPELARKAARKGNAKAIASGKLHFLDSEQARAAQVKSVEARKAKRAA